MYWDNRTKQKLLALYEGELDRKTTIQKELKKLPGGKLTVKQNRGNYLLLYRKDGSREEGITRNRDLCRKYARKCFLERQLECCEINCGAVKAALESIYRAEKHRKKSVRSGAFARLSQTFPDGDFRYSTEALEWMNAPYERNPYYPEGLRYRTKNGILVRSKSERSIANSLIENGIPFRYEAKIIINGKVYYPDFTILCSDGTILLWEHFGMEDDDDYFMKSCWKLRNYRKAGYNTHKNLICTYEDDLLSEEHLDFLIQRYIW